MRAQVAFEYMMIFGLAIAFVIPVWIYAATVQQGAGDELSSSYAKNAARQITSAADLVHTQGPPAKVRLSVYIPSRVEDANISGKTVNFRMALSSGVSDIFSDSISDLNGTLPAAEGNYFISVESKGNYVQVTQE